MRRALVLSLLAACAPVPKAPARPIRCGEPQAIAELATVDRAPVLGLANIQRSMRLLATSTAEHPNRVRILFYGQSITQSAWSRQVEQDLRATYPHAKLEIENRALGGFSSERLVETAETDLVPWQPDLVIFHVYGAHDRYEELVRLVRAETGAELLLQTDHPVNQADLEEPLEPCASPPDAAHWSAFMNQAFLPSLVRQHQVALCDLRSSWKLYLHDTQRPPTDLLADAIHLNAEGDRRMATLVQSCLRYEPTLNSPAEDWVETFEAQQLVRSEHGVQLAFRGERVEATLAPGFGTMHVQIDGAPPSTRPELYRFARAHAREGGKWPPLRGLVRRVPLELETFTFTLTRDAEGFAFSVEGTRSGNEGEGRTNESFTSNSGRLVIDPTDWDIDYAFELAGVPVPDIFHVDLRVEAQFADAFEADPTGRTVTLASGLTSGAHLLELEGDSSALRAITIVRPREF